MKTQQNSAVRESATLNAAWTYFCDTLGYPELSETLVRFGDRTRFVPRHKLTVHGSESERSIWIEIQEQTLNGSAEVNASSVLADVAVTVQAFHMCGSNDAFQETVWDDARSVRKASGMLNRMRSRTSKGETTSPALEALKDHDGFDGTRHIEARGPRIVATGKNTAWKRFSQKWIEDNGGVFFGSGQLKADPKEESSKPEIVKFTEKMDIPAIKEMVANLKALCERAERGTTIVNEIGNKLPFNVNAVRTYASASNRRSREQTEKQWERERSALLSALFTLEGFTATQKQMDVIRSCFGLRVERPVTKEAKQPVNVQTEQKVPVNAAEIAHD